MNARVAESTDERETHPLPLPQLLYRRVKGGLVHPLPAERLQHLAVPEERGEQSSWQRGVRGPRGRRTAGGRTGS